MNHNNLRQVIHDHMAQIADQHATALYPHMDADTAAQLFAELTDTALAYQMEVDAELLTPAPASPWPPPAPLRSGHPAEMSRAGRARPNISGALDDLRL